MGQSQDMQARQGIEAAVGAAGKAIPTGLLFAAFAGLSKR